MAIFSRYLNIVNSLWQNIKKALTFLKNDDFKVVQNYLKSKDLKFTLQIVKEHKKVKLENNTIKLIYLNS